jgi:hypothetical protein
MLVVIILEGKNINTAKNYTVMLLEHDKLAEHIDVTKSMGINVKLNRIHNITFIFLLFSVL